MSIIATCTRFNMGKKIALLGHFPPSTAFSKSKRTYSGFMVGHLGDIDLVWVISKSQASMER